jgi:hypothetical protein
MYWATVLAALDHRAAELGHSAGQLDAVRLPTTVRKRDL